MWSQLESRLNPISWELWSKNSNLELPKSKEKALIPPGQSAIGCMVPQEVRSIPLRHFWVRWFLQTHRSYLEKGEEISQHSQQLEEEHTALARQRGSE